MNRSFVDESKSVYRYDPRSGLFYSSGGRKHFDSKSVCPSTQQSTSTNDEKNPLQGTRRMFYGYNKANTEINVHDEIKQWKSKKIEKRQLEKEEWKQNAKMLEEYNPWGKPGGGAPNVSLPHVELFPPAAEVYRPSLYDRNLKSERRIDAPFATSQADTSRAESRNNRLEKCRSLCGNDMSVKNTSISPTNGSNNQDSWNKPSPRRSYVEANNSSSIPTERRRDYLDAPFATSQADTSQAESHNNLSEKYRSLRENTCLSPVGASNNQDSWNKLSPRRSYAETYNSPSTTTERRRDYLDAPFATSQADTSRAESRNNRSEKCRSLCENDMSLKNTSISPIGSANNQDSWNKPSPRRSYVETSKSSSTPNEQSVLSRRQANENQPDETLRSSQNSRASVHSNGKGDTSLARNRRSVGDILTNSDSKDRNVNDFSKSTPQTPLRQSKRDDNFFTTTSQKPDNRPRPSCAIVPGLAPPQPGNGQIEPKRHYAHQRTDPMGLYSTPGYLESPFSNSRSDADSFSKKSPTRGCIKRFEQKSTDIFGASIGPDPTVTKMQTAYVCRPPYALDP